MRNYRKIAFREHGEKCAECGSTENLHVHHKDGNRENNEPKNLVPLCKDCHWDRHRDEVAERASGPQGSGEPTYGKTDEYREELAERASGPNKAQPRGQSDTRWTDVDNAILDLLTEGRVIVPYVEDETGYSSEYIRSRLTRLIEHGHVRKVYTGLYELANDPREDGDWDE